MSYSWELAFYNIVTGDCILSSNANWLKAAMNHKLFLLMPDLCYSWVLMKTANLSLKIAILVQIDVLIWSLDMKCPSESASIKILFEVIPDCHYVSVLVQNALKFMCNGTKRLTLKYFVFKKNFIGYPKRQKYFTTSNFHMKYPMVNFSQTKVYDA